MKSHPEISNPWALAWWMSDTGGKTSEADPALDLIVRWEDFEKSPEYQAYSEKYPMGEANSTSSLGQLARPGKPIESKKGTLTIGVRLLEAGVEPNEQAREVQVLIIQEGMGNRVDRHYYSGELLEKIAPMFDGVKAYANHPSKTEETDRPERNINDIVGWYHSPKVITMENGKKAISATLKIIDGDAYGWAWNLVKEAAAFAKKFKDKDLVGVSINAFGASHQIDGAEGPINMVDDLNEVQSADIVTQAGAGGGFRLREAIKKALMKEGSIQGGHQMKDLFMKHGEGLKGLRHAISQDPTHEKAYGPAVDALIKHHEEMAAGYEAETNKGGEPEGGMKPELKVEPKADEAPVEESDAAMAARYQKGEMSATEKKIYEQLCEARVIEKARVNAEMIEKHIKESGIPEVYADDLRVLCTGKSEPEIKRMVETRKKIVESIHGNRAAGAGASAGGKPSESKIKESLATAGVPMKSTK